MRVAADQQVLQNGRVLEQLDVLERARNAELGHFVRRQRGQLAPFELDLAGGRRVDAADQVEHRRLARSVRPDQREHLAALHIEADAIDRENAAEANAQVAGGQEDFSHLNRSDL